MKDLNKSMHIQQVTEQKMPPEGHGVLAQVRALVSSAGPDLNDYVDKNYIASYSNLSMNNLQGGQAKTRNRNRM